MSEQNPTNKELYDLIQKHTEEDDKRFSQLATKHDLNDLSMCITTLTDKMQPMIDFLFTLNSLNRFLKWGGMTFFAFLAIVYFLIKR